MQGINQLACSVLYHVTKYDVTWYCCANCEKILFNFTNRQIKTTVFGFETFSRFLPPVWSVDWGFRKPDENARQKPISVQCAVPRDTDVDIVRRSCLILDLKTAKIVGSVLYGASFTVFRNGFRSRLVFVGLSWPLQLRFTETVFVFAIPAPTPTPLSLRAKTDLRKRDENEIRFRKP